MQSTNVTRSRGNFSIRLCLRWLTGEFFLPWKFTKFVSGFFEVYKVNWRYEANYLGFEKTFDSIACRISITSRKFWRNFQEYSWQEFSQFWPSLEGLKNSIFEPFWNKFWSIFRQIKFSENCSKVLLKQNLTELPPNEFLMRLHQTENILHRCTKTFPRLRTPPESRKKEQILWFEPEKV